MVGRLLGPYRILQPLGGGGVGVAYRAVDTRLDRVVALKTLPPAFWDDPERGRRLLREAKAASALNHPNIVTIYDCRHDVPAGARRCAHVSGPSGGQSTERLDRSRRE